MTMPRRWQMEEAHSTAVRPRSIEDIAEMLEPVTDDDGNCFECGDPMFRQDNYGQRIPTHAPMTEEYEGVEILIQVVCVHCAYVENRPTKVCFQSPMQIVDRTTAAENQEVKQVAADAADSLENAKATYAFAVGLSDTPPQLPGRDPMRQIGPGRRALGGGRPEIGPARPPFFD